MAKGTVPRVYEAMLRDHTRRHRQMAFVTGPRQVGKSTSCRALTTAAAYLSWDNDDDRRVLESGPNAVADRVGLHRLGTQRKVVVLDELHKYRRWKTLAKGLFDAFEDRAAIVVTGSSRLDVYRRGGDSLMGRYFTFRMHPLSIAELVHARIPKSPIRAPKRLPEQDLAALLEYGGYPEVFDERDARFHRRWVDLRRQQLVREDIRDLTRVQELGQIESLLRLLHERSGAQLVYSTLANEIRVAVETVRRWVDTLEAFHAGFRVRPWSTNVAKSLRKEPKWYASDWSDIADPGARTETFVACALMKAVNGWTDLGLGAFELRYLRDKQKREVDFVVVRGKKPWFLVEVKLADTRLTPELGYFQAQIGAEHAFQAVMEMEYVDASCFDGHSGRSRGAGPMVVPVRTLLSQLV